MKKIPLTRGLVALVDDSDYAELSKFNWWIQKTERRRYAYGYVNGKQILMHRFIVRPVKGKHVDHISGDGLDNRRSNLRICSCAENSRGFRRKRKNKTSQYRGVCWFKPHELWRARISFEKIQFCLGYFDSEIKAALAYDAAAKQFFGEFASPNFK